MEEYRQIKILNTIDLIGVVIIELRKRKEHWSFLFSARFRVVSTQASLLTATRKCCYCRHRLRQQRGVVMETFFEPAYAHLERPPETLAKIPPGKKMPESSMSVPHPPARPKASIFLEQGLDPRSTVYLLHDAMCIGEKIINDEDCFILKLETGLAAREAQSRPNYEIIHHTIWGYFSQRPGLLIQFEDSRLLSLRTKGDKDVFWETSTESVMEEHR